MEDRRGEGLHRLVDTSDEFSRVVLRMAFYELKDLVRTKLRTISISLGAM
jgi:hypothetical protein